MVRKVAIQDPLEPRAAEWHGFVTSLLELVLLISPTTMRESGKFERLQAALPAHTPSFPEVIQERSRLPRILRAHHTVIGMAKHDDLSLAWLFRQR
jgi:hypothetical protein